MKGIITILTFFALSMPAYTQNTEVAVMPYGNDEFLYYGVESTFKVVVEGVFCSDYNIKFVYGSVIKNGCELSIILMDSLVWFPEIEISYQGKLDTLIFVRRKLPEPSVSINGFDLHRRRGATKLDYVKAYYPELGLSCQIKEFKVEFIKDDSVVYKSFNDGSLFSYQDKEAFLDLSSGDKVILMDIVVKCNNLITRKVSDVNFAIP